MATTNHNETQPEQPAKRLSRGDVISKIEEMARSGEHEDVLNACKHAIDTARQQGSDDQYKGTIAL